MVCMPKLTKPWHLGNFYLSTALGSLIELVTQLLVYVDCCAADAPCAIQAGCPEKA
jgi:hypothetical protein